MVEITAKEKAEELFDKFYSITGPFTEAKQCALIAVDEIINESLEFNQQSSWDERDLYWQEVRREIEKL
jgi:hypothetical protein